MLILFNIKTINLLLQINNLEIVRYEIRLPEAENQKKEVFKVFINEEVL